MSGTFAYTFYSYLKFKQTQFTSIVINFNYIAMSIITQSVYLFIVHLHVVKCLYTSVHVISAYFT